MNPKPSSLDFYAFLENYREKIVGCFIKKVYQIAETDFLFQLYGSGVGKSYLVISLKKGLLFYDADRPDAATPLSMRLRKSLSERKILAVEQINFDRVVKLTLHTGQEVILEMFRDGNFIITNEGKIEFASDQREWRNRKILKGEPYIPPSANNPLELTDDEFMEVLSNSKASVVQTLATRLNLGGDMAEEVLFRAGIDKHIPARDSGSHLEKIRDGIRKLLEETRGSGAHYYEDENLLTPIPMVHLEKTPDRSYEDFNAGLLEYVQEHFPTDEGQDPITRRIESMTKSIQEFQKQKELSFQRGNSIMTDLQHFESIMKKLRKMKDSRNLKELKEFDGYPVTGYNSASKEIEIEVQELKLKLDLNLTAGQNANNYYQKSKDFKSKIEGAYKAIEDTKAKRVIKEKVTKKKRKKEWFEIYHWFISSEGFLVIAGKDAKSNERIVKRHLKDKDLYVHADVYGAPSTIIKTEGKDPTDATLREACAFAVSYSRAWPAGMTTGAAYWVYPSQVSKTPESGEFVSTGSWIVRGKRNYLFDLPLKLAIGMGQYKEEAKPMVRPVIDGDSEIKDFVVIRPGDEKRNAIAQKISKKFAVDRDEIDTLLPSGTTSIESGL